MLAKYTTLCIVCSIITSCSSQKFSGIMSSDEYKQLSSTLLGPYILELNIGSGKLLYYGAIHSTDTTNSQFHDIETLWHEFQPTIAFTEGCLWPLEKSRHQAIQKHGEQGLVRYLAHRDHVKIRCLDPKILQQALFLAKHFNSEEVKIFFVLRQVVINRRMHINQDNATLVMSIIQEFSKLEIYRGAPCNLSEFEIMIRSRFPELKQWQKIDCSYFYFQHQGNFLPEIHQILNDYRDQHMLQTILAALKKGERVFAAVGRSHVVKQEPVLASISNF